MKNPIALLYNKLHPAEPPRPAPSTAETRQQAEDTAVSAENVLEHVLENETKVNSITTALRDKRGPADQFAWLAEQAMRGTIQ